jgi:phosphoglycolate phosphatase-like HAD superfamily hydrolase
MRIGLDLDGTIITCKSKQCVLIATIAKAFDLPFCESEYWQDKRSGLNNKLALINQGISDELSSKINKIWIDNIEQVQWAGLDKLLEGSVEALSDLKADGHTLHLISARNNIQNARLQLEWLGLSKLFETIDFVSIQSKKNKSFYFKKREIDCYFGDTEADAKESKVADIDFYSVLSGMRNIEFFNNLELENDISLNLNQAIPHILKTEKQ